MSCEDDQSECVEMYEEMKKSGLLTEEDEAMYQELLADFTRAYDNDWDMRDVLGAFGYQLQEIRDSHNLTTPLPWFMS